MAARRPGCVPSSVGRGLRQQRFAERRPSPGRPEEDAYDQYFVPFGRSPDADMALKPFHLRRQGRRAGTMPLQRFATFGTPTRSATLPVRCAGAVAVVSIAFALRYVLYGP